MASPWKSESAVKGLRVEIFARKYYPSLDGTERHTALAEGKATCLSLLPHGECGSGRSPELKFRVGVRLPFSKGKEDWGAVRRRRGKAPYPPRRAPCFDSFAVKNRKNNATKLWKENERAVFGQICRSYGLEVEAERKARGSLSVDEYKEARDAMLEEITQEVQKATQELSEITGKVKTLEQKLEAYSEPEADLREVEELLERGKKGITGKTSYSKKDNEKIAAALKHGASADVQVKRLQDDVKREQGTAEYFRNQTRNLHEKMQELQGNVSELEEKLEAKTKEHTIVEMFKSFRQRREQERMEREAAREREAQERENSRSRKMTK